MSAARLDDALLSRAGALSSATLHEAGKRIGALPAVLKPHAPDVRLCGRAFPVRSPSGDNLWLHHAIYAAAPGDVLVVDVGEDGEYGFWGDVMTVAAQKRGLAGLVINGGVRDGLRMLEVGFPVFSAMRAIRGTGKDADGWGSLGEPVTIGDVDIRRGDLVFGDFDGVVVLPAERAEDVVTAGEQRDRDEQQILDRLERGETTIQIYNLPTPSHMKRP